MRSKLAALLALILVGACFEYLFAPRPSWPFDLLGLTSKVLPPVLGDFRRTRQWTNPLDTRTLEVGASYRNKVETEASLDIRLGAWLPHNGIVCLLVRGDPMLWQRLLVVQTAKASAVFDAALFQDRQGLLLFATTECYSTGCLVPERFGLLLPIVSAFADLPVPVSIEVRETNELPGESLSASSERLLQDFRRFAASLRLTRLAEYRLVTSRK